MSAPPPYVTRYSAVEDTCEWRLTDEALELRTLAAEPRPPELVPWEFITQVRLREISSEARNLRVCELTLRNGRVLTIPDNSYVSFATFREQHAEFHAFLRQLHDRLAPRAPTCRFVRGDAPAWRAFNALMLLVGAAGLIFIVWLGRQSAGGISWATVVSLGLLLLVAGAQFGTSKERSYAPDRLPADFGGPSEQPPGRT